MQINKKDFLNKIKDAKINTEPFDHLVIENLLPDDFYKKLSQDFSNEQFNGRYSRGSYGNRERFGVDITDYNTWSRSGKNISTTLHKNNYNALSTNGSKSIKTFFDFLLENHQDLYSTLCSKLQTTKIKDEYFFHASMTKDSVGYEIEKHTDNEENIFTILFYAPETDANKDFGLHVYKDAKTESGAKSIDFMPNRMLVFAPCEPNKDRTPTWHQVKRLSDKLVGSRNSFQIFFYKNQA